MRGRRELPKTGDLVVLTVDDGVEVETFVSVSRPQNEVTGGEQTPGDAVVTGPRHAFVVVQVPGDKVKVC